ncbi:MAG: DUF1553 domain-containing protein [Isosphaeraceae bacterium]
MMDDNETRRRRCSIEAGLIFLIMFSTGSSVMLARAGDTNPKGASSAKADPAAVEFFEKDVRPILATRCQGCHGPAKQKGGLRLDARASILAGGTSGPAIVLGDPKESLLVDAINYGETNQMPPKSKLSDGEIATLTRWVRMGAPWGFESGSVAKSTADSGRSSSKETDWQSLFRARLQYWCFQPIRRVTLPPSKGTRGWVRNPIDAFVLAGLDEHGLQPAPEASRRTLIRRLTYDLTGLPPSLDEIAAFLDDASPDAYERLVDRLLASPRYGERWARHWLDLVRYAETAGHEFDYDIINASRYRDYVIRAMNVDVPYDQFVVEQLAGDLLPQPRRHPVEGFNESIIGTGCYFLGEGTHSPVDVREEEVRRTDNQIDVFAKAFLGLTVSCARCHDHKFDPISNHDYYALAGFLRSSRYQQAFIDPPGHLDALTRRLEGSEKQVLALLAEAEPALTDPLREQAAVVLRHVAHPMDSRNASSALAKKPGDSPEILFEDFNRDSFDGWFVTGDAFGHRPTQVNDIRLDMSGKVARISRVAPGVAHSGMASSRLCGVLRSRAFTIESRYIHYRVAGRGGVLNVVVDGFEKIRSPIYGGLTTTVDVGDRPGWVTQDVGMWLGHTAYLEIADGSIMDFQGATTRLHDGHGYIAVNEIRMSNRPNTSAAPELAGDASVDLGQVVSALRPTQDRLADRLSSAIAEARSTESQIHDPTLALAIADGTGLDERILIRGNHKNPGEVVPRRFLQVLGGNNGCTTEAGSGRLDLARKVVDPGSNPLTPRVLVNRLWKHHFGEGLVKSTDDFGAMGRKPTHPELLDWLASELVQRGWSTKAIHRLIVTSSTYRMSSVPIEAADRIDPENTYLHRMNVRRLEAEAIRDGLLRVSGGLVETMYGASVPTHLTSFMEGRGRPGQSGPLDGDGRRSIYLAVRRNFLNPMFLAFDTPVPFSTMGRRNVSNVPAQALTLMNDPMIIRQAHRWAERVVRAPGRTDRERLDDLFLSAFGRTPTPDEIRSCLDFLGRSKPIDERAPSNGLGADAKGDPAAWTDLCHILINMKEFIFID